MSRLQFGREACGDLPVAKRREGLVTNGIGGYTAGTVAGLLTRWYSGILVAALDPPLGWTLLLTKLDETATYDGRKYPLFANRWGEGSVEPAGFRQSESFHLEGTTPGGYGGDQGCEVRVAQMPMSHVGCALEVDEARGVMTAVVDEETDRILGGAVLDLEDGEVESLLQVAMMGPSYTALREAMLPQPVLAESLNNLFATRN